MIVIKLIELASGKPSRFDGGYVVRYDPLWAPPTGYDGGWLEVTDDIAKAKQFKDIGEARTYWMQENGRTRPDGRPDRPLTAYTVELGTIKNG